MISSKKETYGNSMVADCPVESTTEEKNNNRNVRLRNPVRKKLDNNIRHQKNMRALFANLSKVAKEGTEEEKKNARAEACKRLEYLLRSIIKTHFFSYIQADPQLYDDLMVAAQCGIIQSLPGYDPSKGLPSTYFYPRIVHEMVEENCIVKHGVSVKNFIIRRKMFEIDRAFEKWGRVPTLADYSLLTGNSINVIRNTRTLWEIGNAKLENTEFKLDQIAGKRNLHYMDPETVYLNKAEILLINNKIAQKFTDSQQEIFSYYRNGIKPAGIAKIVNKTEDSIRTVIESCRNTLKYDPDIREMFDLNEY